MCCQPILLWIPVEFFVFVILSLSLYWLATESILTMESSLFYWIRFADACSNRKPFIKFENLRIGPYSLVNKKQFKHTLAAFEWAHSFLLSLTKSIENGIINTFQCLFLSSHRSSISNTIVSPRNSLITKII